MVMGKSNGHAKGVSTFLSYSFVKMNSLSRSLPLLTRHSFRTFRSSAALLNNDISVDMLDGKNAVLTMQRKPANLLTLEFLQSMNQALVEADKNKEIKGLILKSGVRNIYSGGIDISELHQPTPARYCFSSFSRLLSSDASLQQFWGALQDLWLTLYSLKTPTVAAINGAAPAGGCMLALCCDERIMLSSAAHIGLNETKLGIVAPENIFFLPYERAVGVRNAERLLQLGAVLPPNEALKVGLIDQVVESDEELMKQAVETLKQYQAIPSFARYTQKMLHRGPLVKKLQAERETDLKSVCGLLLSPDVQNNISNYVAALKQKK